MVCTLGALPASAHESVTVRVTETGFEPAVVTVAPGESVSFRIERAESWVASDVHPTHTSYPGSDIRRCGTDTTQMFDACRPYTRGEEYVFRFEKSGEWRYHDHLHPEFSGTIIVTGEREASLAWTSALSLSERLKAMGVKFFYTLMPARGEKVLRGVDWFAVAQDDAAFEYYFRLFGHDRILDEIERDMQEIHAAGGPGPKPFCHVLGHFLGRLAVWVEGASALEQTGLDRRCQMGFYHGMMEASFGELGDEAVKSVAARCLATEGDHPYRRASCIHAIGHGLLVYHGYNLPEALKKCQLIDEEKARPLCYHGAFMENAFVGLGFALGHTTPWVRKGDPFFPCSSPLLPDLPGVREQCHFGQPAIWRGEMLPPEMQMGRCASLQEPFRTHCFQGVGFSEAAWTLSEASELAALCGSAPMKNDRHNCFVGVLVMKVVVETGEDDYAQSPFCAQFGFAPGDPACNAFVKEHLAWGYML